jgi:hypothetical protein
VLGDPWIFGVVFVAPLAALAAVLLADTFGNVSWITLPLIAGVIAAVYAFASGFGPIKTAGLAAATTVVSVVLWIPVTLVVVVVVTVVQIAYDR